MRISDWSSYVCSSDLIIHRQGDARAGEVEHVEVDGLAVLAIEHQAQLDGAGDARVGGAVLVAESMTADDDRVGPARNQARHVRNHDRFAEHDAAQEVADGAVGALPHLLERSEEHNSELQSLMRISYDAFRSKKK